MEHLERSIAEGLLSIRAVFFRPNEPFTWASGIKSPVYCDNRLILTAPEVRTQVESALCECFFLAIAVLSKQRFRTFADSIIPYPCGFV